MNSLEDALHALAGPGLSIADAKRSPHLASAGLYAVYGPPSVWLQLGLGEPPDPGPLYVGKSESSFKSRDLEDHFGNGNTGRSTLRRSFAALLAAELGLDPVPRSANPESRRKYAPMYSLSGAHDRILTTWMHDNLTLAMWPCRSIETIKTREKEVIPEMRPPLCIDGKWTNPWQPMIDGARRRMTKIVRGGPG